MNTHRFNTTRPTAMLLAATLLTGCASTPTTHAVNGTAAVANTADPAGTYNFRSELGGGPFDGVIHISRAADGTHDGTLTTPITGELPVTAVDVESGRVRITASGKLGYAVLNLLPGSRPQEFTGDWSYGGESNTLTATRVSTKVAHVPQSLALTSAEMQRYVGTYDITAVKLQVRVFEQKGRLMAQATGQGAFPLLNKGAHLFHAPASVGIAFQFVVENDRATGFSLQQHGKTFQAVRIQ